MVVMVGIDVHKATHTAVAVDEAGRQLGRPAHGAGHRCRASAAAAAGRGGSSPGDGCGSRSRTAGTCPTRLERALLAAGQTVVRVPPKLMAAGPVVSARTRGKSDPIDALAIARAALREPDLPVAEHTHASPARSGCWSTTARTWSPCAPRCRTGCAGTCTSSTRSSTRRPAAWTAAAQLDRLPTRLGRAAGAARCGRLAAGAGRPTSATLTGADQRTWSRSSPSWSGPQAPQLLALPGCGALTAAKIARRDGQPGPVPLRGLLRHARRRRPDPGVLGQDRPAPARPRRQPAAQRRAAPHRGHPDPPRRPRPAPTTSADAPRGDTTMEALRALKRRLARVVFNLPPAPTDHRGRHSSGRGLT